MGTSGKGVGSGALVAFRAALKSGPMTDAYHGDTNPPNAVLEALGQETSAYHSTIPAKSRLFSVGQNLR